MHETELFIACARAAFSFSILSLICLVFHGHCRGQLSSALSFIYIVNHRPCHFFTCKPDFMLYRALVISAASSYV